MILINCPTCGKRREFERPEDAPHRPFCSDRCQKIDLGKWLNEEYRISDPAPPNPIPSPPNDPDNSP